VLAGWLCTLAATVLLSVSQLSPATAGSISVPESVALEAIVGTTEIIEVDAVFTPDPGFDNINWAVESLFPPFSAFLGADCINQTDCPLLVFFKPPGSGSFAGSLTVVVAESTPDFGNTYASGGGRLAARVSLCPINLLINGHTYDDGNGSFRP
jgi:hypothetical protein